MCFPKAIISKSSLIAFILVFGILSVASADVIFVSGDVSGTWSADSVFVTDSTYIAPGNTLIIEPGVRVLFLTANYFTVNDGAILQAVGTAADSIYFLPATAGYNTLGIDFLNASNESILEYCWFSHALYSAIKLSGSNITIRNCFLDDNPGYSQGGGIAALAGSDAKIEYNTITNNNGNYEGGGIYCDDSSPVIRGNLIADNSASGLGGAIACENYSHPLIVDNMFSNNVAAGQIFPPGPGEGGAIYTSDESNPTIIGNYFYQNRVTSGGGSAYEGGGAIFVFSGSPTIMNNVFDGNIAENDDGGAIFLFNSNSQMINNTFTNNSANQNGGCIYISLSAFPRIVNSIIYYNYSGLGTQIFLTNSDISITYSDIEGGWEGDGNVDVDPLFRNPGGSDYHLKAIVCGDSDDSPLIDAGNPDYSDSLLDCDWGLGTLISDMGAYGGGDTLQVGIANENTNLPSRFALLRNYPNPFNNSTSIRYELPSAARVVVDIFDVLGRNVKSIRPGLQQAGLNQVIFNADEFSSGVYYYKLKAGEYQASSSMTLLK